jgi:hypothetical protein
LIIRSVPMFPLPMMATLTLINGPLIRPVDQRDPAYVPAAEKVIGSCRNLA